MTSPSQELTEARAHVSYLLECDILTASDEKALRRLLSATEPTPEPSGDLVEQFDDVYCKASGAHTVAHGFGFEQREKGIRAVLSHLAVLGMGEMEKALPEVDAIASELRKHKPGAGVAAEVARDFIQASLAPVLAAMAERVRMAEAERDEHKEARRLAEEAAHEATQDATSEAFQRDAEKARADAAESRLARVRAVTAEDHGHAASQHGASSLTAPYVAATSFLAGAEYATALIRSRLDEGVSEPITRKRGIYVASKTKHAPRWIALRAGGLPIISTWIDEAGHGQSGSLADLWRRNVSEASVASVVLAYHEPGDIPKGALVEMGAALAAGTRVLWVGPSDGQTLVHHPLITKCNDLAQAISVAAIIVNEGAEAQT
jgi:hypothetical protein